MTTKPADPEQIQQWRDAECPWWAKLRRARSHIAEVNQRVADFQQLGPWSIQTEAGRTPNETAYRLRVHKEVPADLLTAIGDVVHNMRSSLDSVAYELARYHFGLKLSPEQESLTEFPITENAAAFESWFNKKRRPYLRSDLYGVQERAALRCAQPFWLSEEASERGIDAASIRANEWNASVLRRLHLLSNIDKHRRLPIVTWFTDLAFWETPHDGSSLVWEPATSSTSKFVDGELLGYLRNQSGSAAPDVRVMHDMRLGLLDDANRRSALGDDLSSWIGNISGWTIPRILIVAAGYATPIFIDGSWQAI